MRTFLSVALATAFVPALTAQIAVSVDTVTPVGILQSQPAFFASVAAGVPANNLLLESQGYPGFGSVLQVFPGSTATSRTLLVRSSIVLVGNPAAIVSGTTPSPVAAGAVAGPVEFLARFQALPGTPGTLRLTFESLSTGAGAAGVVSQALIDVDADGTAEVTGPVTNLPFPRTIDNSGQLLVRLQYEHHATSVGVVSNQRVFLEFVPDPISVCTITPYGTGCGGAIAAGSAMTVGPQRAVTLLSAGGFPLSPVLSVFGTVTSGPTLPGGCVLQNDAASALLLVTDGFGYAAQSFMLPATAVGTIYQQFVSIDPTTFAFRASNGLEIACTP